MSEMENIIREFVVESREGLDQVSQDLTTLEEDPSSREILARIAGTIRSIKGSCRFLGFDRLEALTHVGENLLSRLRGEALAASPEIAAALVRMVDAIRQTLMGIETDGADGAFDWAELIEVINAFQGHESTRAATGYEKTPPGATAVPVFDSGIAHGRVEAEPAAAPKTMGEILVEGGQVDAEQIEAAVVQQSEGDPRHIGEILVERGSLRPEAVKAALAMQQGGDCRWHRGDGFHSSGSRR
jgi:two-component system chemotaxis sensor kinase CheA